jgi:hypothetical protein
MNLTINFSIFFREKVQCLPVLCYLLENGNTTYFQYRTGKVPDVIEEFKAAVSYTDENVSSDVGNDNVCHSFISNRN